MLPALFTRRILSYGPPSFLSFIVKRRLKSASRTFIMEERHFKNPFSDYDGVTLIDRQGKVSLPGQNSFDPKGFVLLVSAQKRSSVLGDVYNAFI